MMPDTVIVEAKPAIVVPTKHWWQSQRIKGGIAGLILAAGMVGVAADQLIALIKDQQAVLPPQWFASIMTALGIAKIIAGFVALEGSLRVGDIVKKDPA